jgi:hypothetical protein
MGDFHFLVIAGLILRLTNGHYNPLAVVLLFGAYMVWLARLRLPTVVVGSETAMVAAGLSLALQAVIPALIYPSSSSLLVAIQLLSALASILVFTAPITGSLLGSRSRLSAFALVLVMICWWLVPGASPGPSIDVFVILSQSAQHLWNGINPYFAEFPDIYGGAYQYTPKLSYMPGILLPSAMGSIFGDPRYASVFGLMVAVMAAGTLFSRSGDGEEVIPRILVWASLATTIFVVEQAWTDAIVIGWISLLYMARRWSPWWFTAVIFGILACTKTTVAPVLALFFIRHYRDCGFASATRLALVGFATFLLIQVPFAWESPARYLTTILSTSTELPVRTDSLNLTAFFVNVLGITPPTAFFGLWFVACLVTAIICALRVAHLDDTTEARLIAGSLTATFLLAHGAFCNYYFFALYFVWLAFLGSKKSRVST